MPQMGVGVGSSIGGNGNGGHWKGKESREEVRKGEDGTGVGTYLSGLLERCEEHE